MNFCAASPRSAGGGLTQKAQLPTIEENAPSGMRRLIGLCLLAPSLALGPRAMAQVAPALPASMIAEPGQTKSNSLTSGQRSSLSISASSSIGTSVNMSATDGYTSEVQTKFVPSSGQFTSSFGGETGTIRADVSNIRSESANNYSADGSGLVVNGSKESSATGSAVVEGMSATVGATLNPSESSISASAKPIASNGQATSTAAGVGNSNAAGSLNMNNAMNVDISNTSFSNAFSQAF